MIEARILGKDDRVELLNGEILDKFPTTPLHNGVSIHLSHEFGQVGQGKMIARQNGPALIDDWSEPEPDLMLLKFRSDYYRSAHPGPDDILLLIEVADSSLKTDREIKIPLYARNGIAECWIVDLAGKSIEVYRAPVDGRYTHMQIFRGTDVIAPIAFPNHAIKLNEIFPA